MLSFTGRLKQRKSFNGITVALATVHVLLPGTVSAATTDVCGRGGTSCNAFVVNYVNPVILLLTGLVGVVAVISIIVAGIQYSASADDPGVVAKAKQRIFNTVIGLIGYIFLFALLNYLVPGGIL
ncbi:MAG TPA: hypothetical protein VIS56_02480 [Candidatus Saccharimonadales bacterium]